MGQLVEAPIGQGVTQRIDPRKAPLGALLSSENAQVDKEGTYTKRLGLAALASNGATDPEDGVLADGDGELVAISQEALFAHNSTVAAPYWKNRDKVPAYVAKQVGLPFSREGILQTDYAVSADLGFRLVAWIVDPVTAYNSPAGVFAMILTENGNVWLPPVQITSNFTSSTCVRVLICGTTGIVVYDDLTGTDSIKAKKITLTEAGLSTGWSSASILESSTYDVLGGFDACPVDGDATRWILAFRAAAGTGPPAGLISVQRMDTSLALVTGNGTTEVACNAVIGAICATAGELIWIFYWDYDNTRFRVSTLPTASGSTETLPPTTVDSLTAGGNAMFGPGICRRSATQAVVTWSEWSGVGGVLGKSCLLNTSGTFGSPHSTRGLLFCSRPVYDGFDVYAVANTYGAVGQSSTVLVAVDCDVTSNNLQACPVVTVAPRTAGDPADVMPLGDMLGLTTFNYKRFGRGRFGMQLCSDGALRTITHLLADSHAVFQPYELTFDPVRFSAAGPYHRQTARLGRLLYLTGGVPSWFDGRRVGEICYMQNPTLRTTSGTAAAGGGLSQNKTYVYAVVAVQYDSKGVAHRSSPSALVSFALGASGTGWKITFTLPNIHLTTRQDFNDQKSPPALELYRTTGDGTELFRVPYLTGTPWGTLPSSRNNDPTQSTITYVDTCGDADLSGQPLLYTNGGVLDDVNPPSANLCMVHNQRLWLAGCPDRKEYWYSKSLVDGIAPAFNEALRGRIDEGDEITAIASMDDKAILFKRDRIFVVYGDGPSDAGTGSTLSEPQRIIGTVGCVRASSVVVTPIGLLFQSDTGISLLSRSLEVVADFGAEVQDYLVTYPYVVAATLVPKYNQVRFLCSDGSSASLELRYDYRGKRWFPVKTLVSGAQDNMTHAAVVDGTYYVKDDGGTVCNERSAGDAEAYLDESTYVPMMLEFAPLGTAGTQGFQNVSHMLIRCDNRSGHAFSTYQSVDGKVYQAAKSKTRAQLDGITVNGSYEITSHVDVTKNQLLKVKFVDATPATGLVGNGAGYALSGLTFEVTPLDGRRRTTGEAAQQ
jgi:hypothetical protein